LIVDFAVAVVVCFTPLVMGNFALVSVASISKDLLLASVNEIVPAKR